jgi:hypothetical protein
VGAGALLGGITSKLAAVRKAKALKKAAAAARTASDVSEDGVRASLRGAFVDLGDDAGSFIRPRSGSLASDLRNPFGSFASSSSGGGGAGRLSQVVDANFDNVPMLRQSFQRQLSISSVDPDGLISMSNRSSFNMGSIYSAR